MLRPSTLALALCCAVATLASAQQTPALRLTLPPAMLRTTDGPSVAIIGAFDDRRTRELLASGFPARVTVVVELWAGGRWVDDLLRAQGWERIVRYDALAKVYRMARVSGDSIVPEGHYATLAEVSQALATERTAGLPAPRRRRGLYYTANATIATLNSNDLAEVERWLRGEIEPELRGRQVPGSAVTRGVRTLLSRLLGGDVKRLTARTAVFGT